MGEREREIENDVRRLSYWELQPGSDQPRPLPIPAGRSREQTGPRDSQPDNTSAVAQQAEQKRTIPD